MDWQRSLLISAMLVVLYMLFLEWNTFQETNAPKVDIAAVEAMVTPDFPEASLNTSVAVVGEVPTLNDLGAEQVSEPVRTSNTRLVRVSTDVLTVLIDTHGGDIVRVELPQHLIEVGEKESSFILLNRTASTTYIAQSGLIGTDGTDTSAGRPLFKVDADHYVMSEGDDRLAVNLTLQQGDLIRTAFL